MGWLKQFMISWPYMDNAATNLDPYCSKNEEDEGAYYHYLEHFLSHFLLLFVPTPKEKINKSLLANITKLICSEDC